MLFCLYVLPKTLKRYAIAEEEPYYLSDCSGNVAHKLHIPRGVMPGNFSAQNGTDGFPDSSWYCSVMLYCGFPFNGGLARTTACPLYNVNSSFASSSQVESLCFSSNTSGCFLSDQVRAYHVGV
jgi:hypothetical protein